MLWVMGTSTSTVLAHAIFADGVRNVTAGASAIDIKGELYSARSLSSVPLKSSRLAIASRHE